MQIDGMEEDFRVWRGVAGEIEQMDRNVGAIKQDDIVTRAKGFDDVVDLGPFW